MVTLRASWTGDRVEIQVPTYELDERKEIVVTGTAIQGGQQSVGTVGLGGGVELLYHRPSGEGWIFAKTADNVLSKPYVANGNFRDSSAVVTTSGPARGESYVPDESIDPSEYQMIVNADTQSGIALAPSAIRQGITADSDGTEVDLSDGTTVTVYPRQDADEAIRDTETGAPVDSPVGSGGIDGGLDDGGDRGVIGAAVAAVVLLVAGVAAFLGGGD